MGSGRWDAGTYRAFSNNAKLKSTKEVYTGNTIKTGRTSYASNGLDPKGVKVRESRDSDLNPNSTALIVALDVSGTMGMIADVMAKSGLGILFEEILNRKPISDPHLMFMGIGDANYDTAPLQVSQFEADAKIIQQLTDLYLEHGGGGNGFESYNLAWYFAAMHTSIDCFEKRKKRGYLFTIGDEKTPAPLTNEQISHILGDTQERPLSNAELLAIVSKTYDVYHIMVGEGYYGSHYGAEVRKAWSSLLGEKAIWLRDHRKLAEVVVSTIEIAEGRDKDDVVKSWGGDTSMVVSDAVKDLTKKKGQDGGASTGPTRL